MRRNSRWVIILAMFLLGILIAFLSLLFNLFDEHRNQPEETYELPNFQESNIESPGDEIQPAIVPRELPIVGHVVNRDLKGLAGLEIVCGIESVFTNEKGYFDFPPLARQGPLPLSVRKDGEEIARWEVIVGDTPAGPPGDRPAHNPMLIRWSINMIGGEESQGIDVNSGSGKGQPAMELSNVFIEDWGYSGVVHFEGKSILPDDAQLRSAIYFEGQRLVAGADFVKVFNGKFSASYYLPDDFRIYSAGYDFSVFYSSMDDFRNLENWKEKHPEIPWKNLEDYELSSPIYVGFVEEEIADNIRLEKYYDKNLTLALGLKELFFRQFLEVRKLNRGWDSVLLRERENSWLGWARNGAVNSDGEFMQREWRTFLDLQWRPRMRELLEQHSRMTEDKYPRAIKRMHSLLSGLLELSQMLSIMLYNDFGLPRHPKDDYIDEYTAQGDASLVMNRIEDDIKALDRYRTLTKPRAKDDSSSKIRGADK